MYCNKLFTTKLGLKNHFNICTYLKKIGNELTDEPNQQIKTNEDIIKENEELKKIITAFLDINRQVNDVIREIDVNNVKENLDITDLNFSLLTLDMIKAKERGMSLFLYLTTLDSGGISKLFLLDYKYNIFRVKIKNYISYDKNGCYFQKFWYPLMQEHIIIRIFKDIHDVKERKELNDFYENLFQKRDKNIHNIIMNEFKKRILLYDTTIM